MTRVSSGTAGIVSLLVSTFACDCTQSDMRPKVFQVLQVVGRDRNHSSHSIVLIPSFVTTVNTVQDDPCGDLHGEMEQDLQCSSLLLWVCLFA